MSNESLSCYNQYLCMHTDYYKIIYIPQGPFIMYTVVIEAENSAGTGPSKKISFYTKEGGTKI